MIKVLFVCLGNICRSPMAEFIFKDMVKKCGLEKEFFIDSAATSFEEVGNGLYYGAQDKLDEKAIPYTNHKARRITEDDYKKFDYILGMEERNITNIKRIVGEDVDNKIYRLLDFSNNPRDISDPWYTGNFEVAYNDIVEGLEGFLKFINSKRKTK